jgi:hypothetical protein
MKRSWKKSSEKRRSHSGSIKDLEGFYHRLKEDAAKLNDESTIEDAIKKNKSELMEDLGTKDSLLN